MAIKKITLTEDHIKLIKGLKFEAFEMGDLLSVGKITSAISEIESSKENMKKFGKIRDELVRIKDQIETISDKKECHAWGRLYFSCCCTQTGAVVRVFSFGSGKNKCFRYRQRADGGY